MLKDLGVEYVIIGHSERRQILGETDEMINKKVLAALRAGLKVILCVGEIKKGLAEAKNYVSQQLNKDLKGVGDSLIVAYEPVWAIGTGDYCQPEDSLEMIKFIKNIVNFKMIYGGSVDSKNIAGYVKYPEINGALVGGASLKIDEFQKIINEVSKSVKTKSA
jgi:triosephosphate isomerase